VYLQTLMEAGPVLLHASWTTLQISVLAILVGQLLGLPLAVARVTGPRYVKASIDVYVSFFRGVPLLVKILLIYYFLPGIGINVPPAVAAVLALGMASAAYVEEIYRATLSAIPTGQFEAAQMLQFSAFATWTRIVFPQALKNAVPALASEMITILKGSALVSVVGVAELTSSTEIIASENYRPMQMYLTAAAIYLLFTAVIETGSHRLEKRLSVGSR